MQLTLDAQEAELLRRILRNYLGDLRYEIADTDNSRFRSGLQEERGQLEAILRRLSTPGTPQAPPAEGIRDDRRPLDRRS